MFEETSETNSEVLSQSAPSPFGFCPCMDEYSMEPHGRGYAIYFGRCPHRHGFNIANLEKQEVHFPAIQKMIEFANKGLQN